MWDFRQLGWLNLFGWWPSASGTKLRYRISRVFGLCLYFWDFAQVGPEFLGLFLEIAKGSLKGAILNLTTTMMGVMCAVKIGTLIVRQDEIKSIISAFQGMEEGVRKVLPKEVVDRLSAKGEFVAKYSSYTSICLMAVTTHWVLRPLILLFDGERVMVIDAWVPFDLEDRSAWCFIWVNQTVHVFTAMYGFLVFDSVAYSFLEVLQLQIDYLKAALSRLDFSRPGVDYHDTPTLNFCVEHNIMIFKMYGRVDRIIRPVVFMQTICVTVVFCLCVFELSSIEGTTMVKIMNLCELILLALYSTYLYCWLCQEVTDENIKVMRAAYDNNWYVGNERDKRALILLTEVWKRQLTFGFIIQSDLQTFITVMKSSFTYFNFLKAISEE